MAAVIAFRALLTAWLLFVAVHDLRTRRIPAWSTWPLTAGLSVWWAAQGAWQVPLALGLVLTVSSLPRWVDPVALAIQALSFVPGVPPPAAIIVGVWWLLYLTWRYFDFGGGDVALLMALFALFPSVAFALVLAGVTVAVGLPLLLWGRRQRYPLGPIFAGAGIIATWHLPLPFTL